MAGMRDSRGWLAVTGWARRLRLVAPATAVVVVAALLMPMRSAAAADPELPPGATSAPPAQPVGVSDPKGPASTEDTQGRRGPGAPAVVPEPAAPALLPKATPAAAGSGLRVEDSGTRLDALRDALAIGLPVEDPADRTAISTEYVNRCRTRRRRGWR